MRFIIIFLLLFSFSAFSQPPCSGLGATAQTAISVCGTGVYTQVTLPLCTGVQLPLIPGPQCLGDNSLVTDNSTWYKIRIYQSGTLGFTIAPSLPSDNYDWVLFNLTNRNPQDVYTSNLVVAYNQCSTTGNTGCSSTGSGIFNCAAPGSPSNPNFNSLIPVVVGSDYLLMVIGAPFSGPNYSLNLNGGTAVLTNNSAPSVSNVTTVGCNTNQIKVTFSEDVLCSSILANGSQFSIPGAVITSVTSSCTTGTNATSQIFLNLQNPLTTGNYQLNAGNAGVPATQILDVCNQALIPSSSPFPVVAQVAPIINQITLNSCTPTTLKIALSKKVLCSSITSSGSEFSIGPSGSTTITSASIICPTIGTQVTDTILLNLATPLPQGNYTLSINNGTDGNTLVDTCTLSTLNGFTFNFIVPLTPASPVVTPTVSYCLNATATQLTATGTNLLWYTVAIGGTGSATAPTPSTAAGGTIIYYVSQSNGTCESSRSSIAVTVLSTIPAPTVVSPINKCQYNTPTVLTATGTNLLWYTTAMFGVGDAIAPVPPTVTAGTYIFYVSQTISGCESPRVAINVNVTAIPLPPTVVSPLTRCQGSTPIPVTAIGTNILWFNLFSGGTGTATAPTPPTGIIDTYIYYLSQTVGGCESPRGDLIVNIEAVPGPPIVPLTAITYCQNAAATPLAATGMNLLWYTVPAGGTGTTVTPVPLTNTVGVTTYYVNQSAAAGGICPSARVAITVTVSTAPAALTVTSPINICQFATAPALNVTATSGNTLLWYTTLTGGAGSATAPVINTAIASNNTYYVTQTNGSCEATPRKQLIININATPNAPLVNPTVTYCQNQTATILTATGTNLLWYNVASGGTGSATAPTPNTTVVGITDYYVSQSATGGCESLRSLITVTVNPSAAAPTATTPVTYCNNEITTSLSAIGTNLHWYTVPSGGTFTTTAPFPSSATVGTTNYYVSQTPAVGGCESPRTLIAVTIKAISPTPGANTSASFCLNATATALVPPPGVNIIWYNSPVGGVGTSTAPTVNTASVGSTIYYVSQTIVGQCESPRITYTVTINNPPAAPLVTPTITYCQNQTATALTATGAGLLWYTTSSGGTGVATAPIPNTSISGTTSFWVSQTVGCESPRSLITVTVNPSPQTAPVVTSPVVYCVGSATAQLTATSGTNLLWFTNATGGTGTPTAPTPSAASAGNITYYVAQTIGVCEGPRASIVVNILAYPTAPIIVTPQIFCPNSTPSPLTALGTNLLWYSNAIGGIGSTTAPTPATATLGSTTYYVSQSNGNCEGPRTAIVVTVANPLMVNIGIDTALCEGSSVKFLPIVTPSGATYQWRPLGTTATATIDNVTLLNATVSPVNDATYVLKASIGTCEKEDTVNVTVRLKPVVDAGPNTAICLGDSSLLTGSVTNTTGPIASYAWTPSATLSSPTTLVTWAKPLQTTWYTLTTSTDLLAYGCAFTSTDSVRVTIQAPIAANAGSDTIAVKGSQHQLYGSGGTNYTWSSPTANVLNPFIKNPKAIINNDAVFYLKVTDGVGCAGYDTVYVKVYDGPKYYIPNAFTPNGDGVNDIFRPIPVGISNTVYFRVFNRYGELVFETNSYLKGWDGSYKGKQQPNDVYIWMISGTDRNFNKVNEKGTVNLIR